MAMCPIKEQIIPWYRAKNHASEFKFFKLKIVFPSNKIDKLSKVIQPTNPMKALVNFTSKSLRYLENTCAIP